jgi:glucose/arabinose dehydrogenase
MKRLMGALVILCSAAAGSVALNGQGPAAPKQAASSAAKAAGLPPCDADNGGITLPAGFCALVVHEGLGEGRHIVVNTNGDIYVILRRGPTPPAGQQREPGGIVGLRDTNGNGKADVVTEKFGDVGGTGLELRNGFLYFASTTSIGRFKLTAGELKPAGPAEIIVDGFPAGGGHAEKDITFDNAGNVYVNIGLPSNACQIPDRRPGAPGIDPCPQLEERGGIWRFKADVVGQKYSKEARYASGMRQPVALAWHDGHLYAAMNSRDSLDTLFPEKGYTAEDNAFGPSEAMLQIEQGDVFGWPYCYFDSRANTMILAPEYGGDGKTIGRCSQFKAPFATFPAHYAPVDLMFYTHTHFPAKYRGGAFMTSHGSWNRAPYPMGGYNILFQPVGKGKSAGPHEVFADGFKGKEPLMTSSDAVARPNGTTVGPDGTMYITESVEGKIWRVIYRGK